MGEVVDYRNAVDFGNNFLPSLQAFKGCEGVDDRLRRDPLVKRNRRRGKGIGEVVRARHRKKEPAADTAARYKLEIRSTRHPPDVTRANVCTGFCIDAIGCHTSRCVPPKGHYLRKIRIQHE